MKSAMICGSFDPVTRGHADLVRRAAALFDRVYVVLLHNGDKGGLFPWEDRLDFLRAAFAACPNVAVEGSRETAVACARRLGVTCILRGVRGAADLAYEADMAALNRTAGGPETLFLPTDPALSFISSHAVREFLACGLPAEALLSPEVAGEVQARYDALKRSKE